MTDPNDQLTPPLTIKAYPLAGCATVYNADGCPLFTAVELDVAEDLCRVVNSHADLLAASWAVLSKLDYLCGLWGDEAITRSLRDQLRAAVAAAAKPEPPA
jgi:hypothetical protein